MVGLEDVVVMLDICTVLKIVRTNCFQRLENTYEKKNTNHIKINPEMKAYKKTKLTTYVILYLSFFTCCYIIVINAQLDLTGAKNALKCF